ncbi:MAG TPA: hypothetical protein VJL58_00820 [Pyrinomonadaceae bacterium]|nr:hypothetical protein [Pyrinomonadaceae bacterium]
MLKLVTILVSLSILLAACTSSGRSGGIDIIGPGDETSAAGQLILEANADLKAIKKLYEENEDKRTELKKALEANDSEKVRKIADDVVYIINDGFDFGNAAVEKISRAQEMNVNPDYKEYLRLKEEALRKQMAAFEEYRQAARSLRDNYDPKDAQRREKVKVEFKERSENYAKIMETARELSNEANDIAKAAVRKQSQ